MSSVLRDLRHSARHLARHPFFTLTAVLTLAIGMGVNTVAFTVVNGLLFRGSAVSAVAGTGRVETTPGGDEGGNASIDEFQRFEDGTRGTLDLAAEGRLNVNWRHDGITETAYALFVSSRYFEMVNVQPIAGRIAVTAAPGGVPSVVVGERFWRGRLGAASLAGLTLRLNGVDAAVSGVLPDAFTGPAGLYSPDVWMPLDALDAFHTAEALRDRQTRWLFVLGRLRPGLGAAEGQARVEAAAASMSRDWPDTHRRRGARFHLFSTRDGELRGIATASSIAMGVIGLVLLLACFNVANLLLARAVERERDMGIRAALGAGAGTLARLVIAEGLIISALAGAAALTLARWTQAFVGSFAIPIEQPQHIELTPDRTVIAFVALLVVIAGVLPGLWPALGAARVDVLRVLGSQGQASRGRPSRARRVLVAAQIAGSTVFLAIAALFVQTYSGLATRTVGFDHDRLTVAEFDPSSAGYDAARSERFAEDLLARAHALPGVTRAALADSVPFFVGFERRTAVSPSGARCDAESTDCPQYATYAVGAGYFRTLGVPLTAGHEFTTASGAGEVIVNEPMARALWPDGRGLGRTLRIGVGGDARPVTVVGITAMMHTRGLDREPPAFYVPLAPGAFTGTISLVARTEGDPAALVRPLREAAQAIGPDVALQTVKTMRERMAVQLWPFRTIGGLFTICGVLALVLAVTGLAAVVMHAVARRTREFGVRLAIGATRRDIVSEVLRGSAGLLVPGLASGTLVAIGAAHLMRAALVGVNPLDPLTYVLVALIEGAVVLAASAGPAVRASQVDPLAALKAE
jgi:predicted permease